MWTGDLCGRWRSVWDCWGSYKHSKGVSWCKLPPFTLKTHRFSHIHKYLCWRASRCRPNKLGTSVMCGSQKGQRMPASLHKDTVSQFVSLENPVTGTVWVAWWPEKRKKKLSLESKVCVCVRVCFLSVCASGKIRMSQIYAFVKCWICICLWKRGSENESMCHFWLTLKVKISEYCLIWSESTFEIRLISPL